MKRLLLAVLLCCPFILKSQISRSYVLLAKDSVNNVQQFKSKDPFWKHAVAPAVFLGLSAAGWQADENIKAGRNRYVPDFRSELDNYTQYAPGALAFGLKLSGVKGRNRLGRSAINWGGSMLIMGALVNSVKYSAKVMRPDGTTKNSFPSGHTATAFMNASFLHKEYGHVNPLYSILGYSMSTYTGISRSLNNRHWLSDILAGAGIGILSTELSYLIVDSFYRNKGDFFTSFDGRIEIIDPSFVSIKMGPVFYTDAEMFESIGLEGAIEGAYFFNRKWGVGAELGFLHMPFGRSTLDLLAEDEQQIGLSDPVIDMQSVGLVTMMSGAYYSKFIGKKFILQAKALTGIGFGVGGNIDIKGYPQTALSDEITVPFLEYSVGRAWVVGGGASFTALIAPTLGVSLYVDYKYTNPKIKIAVSKEYPEYADDMSENSHISISALSGGLKLVSYF